MDKLVTLLNEYRTEKGERNLNEFEVSQTLDSLKFLRPFIKWLVDNDKIERLAFAESGLLGKYTDFELSYDTPREDYTNMLLMELSIQDSPIEYLISVLR